MCSCRIDAVLLVSGILVLSLLSTYLPNQGATDDGMLRA